MSIRRDPIYIQGDVWRALRLLAKAQSAPEEGRIYTVDEIANGMLLKGIREAFPQIFEHQKAVDKLEKEIIKTL